MKTITILSIAIATSLASHLVLARGHGEGMLNGGNIARHQAKMEEILTRFDVNQDGQITQDEVQSVHADKFKTLDTDGNGLISLEEFKNGAPAHHRNDCQASGQEVTACERMKSHQQAHFQRQDNDGDGQISMAEFMANLPLFDKFDCDENGIITKDDLSQGPCQLPIQ